MRCVPILPISKMKKRIRKFNFFQGYTARRWQCWGLNTLNTVFLLNSYTTQLPQSPPQGPTYPSQERTAPTTQAVVNVSQGSPNGAKNIFPLLALDHQIVQGSRQSWLKCGGTQVRMARQSKGLPAIPHVSVPPAVLLLPIPATGW